MTRVVINTNGVPVDASSIERFMRGFGGEVLRPGDAGYESARRIWNANVDKRPAIIARCSGVADVIAAVKFAREAEILVGIRGGGHNVGGRALCDGGLVIDLSRMRSVHVDSKRRTVRAQGGATLGDVDRETHVFGLAVPLGINSNTGIAGLTLGGGVGWLVRKYGMTCDNVLSFDVVTAEGEHRTASADDNPDLYWGLRGGGGNFGVVTSFEYRAHPVSTVLSGLVIHPRDRAVDVLRFYREFVQSAPDEVTTYAVLLHTPDGTPAIAVGACYCGELDEGERVLQPLRAFGTPLMDAIQPMPFPQMQSLLDGAFPDGNQNYWRSTFLRDFSDASIDAIVELSSHVTSPLSAVVVEYYGGAAGRVEPSATAFAQRQPEFNLLVASQWTDPQESSGHVAWTRGFIEAMRPHSSGAYLLNAIGADGDDTIRAAFGPNYERLLSVKRQYDPTNFFHLNYNINPTPAMAEV